MARKIVVDSIGSNVLSITDDYAVHSVPLNSQVIRISGPGGEIDYKLSQLPLTCKIEELEGRLNIHNGKGRLIYCWRSLDRDQRRWRSPSIGRGRRCRSRSPQERARSPMETITPGSSLASAPAKVSTTSMGSTTYSSIAEKAHSSTASSPTSIPGSRKHRPSADLNRKPICHNPPALENEESLITKENLIDLINDKKKNEDLPMTKDQKKFLLHATCSLLRTTASYHFSEPVKEVPGYHTVIKEPMDLSTLKCKLSDGVYTSVQDYKRDFRLIIDNALQWNEPGSKMRDDAQILDARFQEKMSSMPTSDMEEPRRGTRNGFRRGVLSDSEEDDEAPGRTSKSHPRAPRGVVQTFRAPSRESCLCGRSLAP